MAEIETLGYPTTCYLCGGTIENDRDAELDHKVPVKLGGTSEISNLGWTHKMCNKMKYTMCLEDLLTLAQTILRHHGMAC
jgi:5-methylcytosine-specific restriction endonuclease McrA